MLTVLGFLFGRGGWVFWHLWLWLFALPAAYVAWYFVAVLEPGAGPQGGEAVFVLWLWWFLGYSVAAAVSAILWSKRRTGAAWRRVVVPTAAAFAGWLVLVGFDIQLMTWAGSVEPPPVPRLTAALASGALKAAVLCIHLLAVWRYRRAG
ncbi:MAG: hypothetical protein AB7K86_10640 [Rhodospirillales bacterium]